MSRQGKNSKRLQAEEDLAIQDTLSMTSEERIKLLASLIADKILQDAQANQELYAKITGART